MHWSRKNDTKPTCKLYLQNRVEKYLFLPKFLALDPSWVSLIGDVPAWIAGGPQGCFQASQLVATFWRSHVIVTSLSPQCIRAFPIPPPSSIIFGSPHKSIWTAAVGEEFEALAKDRYRDIVSISAAVTARGIGQRSQALAKISHI